MKTTKNFFMAIIFALTLTSYANAKTCDLHDVVLIDREECQFLGKVVGTEYQCGRITSTSVILSSTNKKPVEIPLDDENFVIVPAKTFGIAKDEEL